MPISPEQRGKRNAYYNAYQRALRERIITHYGGKCKCCGEENRVFLAIDHINNDGEKARKTIPSGSPFYGWIIRNGFPKDLQILCHNCNHAKRLGICPHKLVG